MTHLNPLPFRSRAMERYNRLVKRSVDNLVGANPNYSAAQVRSFVVIRIRIGARPPGFGEHKTRGVKVLEFMCNGIRMDCSRYLLSPFR